MSNFLNKASLDNYGDYCLGFVLTARDFNDGTLGLAWLAKTFEKPGGICDKPITLDGVRKSFNTGIVTVVNYKSRVPEIVSQLTFAHEVGHSFGADHDPMDKECVPGNEKGGNFIMHRRANTGKFRNNKIFSKCSLKQMGIVLHSKIKSKNKSCFKGKEKQ